MSQPNNESTPNQPVKRSRYADIPIAKPPILDPEQDRAKPEDEERADRWPAGQQAPDENPDASEDAQVKHDENAPAGAGLDAESEEGLLAGAEEAGGGKADEEQTASKPVRKRKRLPRSAKIALAYIAIFALALIVTDSILSANLIYPGVRVGSVDVSNMTVEEANEALHQCYGDTVAGKDIHICANRETLQGLQDGSIAPNADAGEDTDEQDRTLWTITAQELEAELSIDDLARAAFEVGRSDGGPLARFTAATSGREIPVRVSLNEDAVETTAQSIEKALCTPRKEYDVRMSGTSAAIVEGKDGTRIDRADFLSRIEELLYTSDNTLAFVPDIAAWPSRTTKEQAQECADVINDALKRGAELGFNQSSVKLGARELAPLVRTMIVEEEAEDESKEPADGSARLSAYLEDSLTKNLLFSKLYQSKGKKGLGLGFLIDGANVRVRIAESEHAPDVAAAREALQHALFDGTDGADAPRIDVAETEIPSEMSLEEALKLGVITVISEYETDFVAGETNRNHNIKLAAEIINNSIIPADGGTWSFNETAGDCNEERGFRGAGAILGSEVIDEIGGGVCQVATTVFNAVYEAGYPIDERKNHSLLMEGYPLGRDAAISWPDLDFVWHNDTGNDILLQTRTSDSWTSVSLLGVAPFYAVATDAGTWVEGEGYASQTRENADLKAGETRVVQEGANGGNITVTRTVTDATGAIIREDAFESVYDPRDEILEIGPETD